MAYSPIKKDGTPKKKPGRKAVPREPSTWVRKAPRPYIWKIGPDEERHRMYQPWLLSRAQANFRGEPFELEFEDYYQLWKNDWDNRGRKPDNMCMTRIDKSGPWAVGNVHVITRLEHLQTQGTKRGGQNMKYSTKTINKPVVYKKMKVTK
jgi:hypothetical protein